MSVCDDTASTKRVRSFPFHAPRLLSLFNQSVKSFVSFSSKLLRYALLVYKRGRNEKRCDTPHGVTHSYIVYSLVHTAVVYIRKTQLQESAKTRKDCHHMDRRKGTTVTIFFVLKKTKVDFQYMHETSQETRALALRATRNRQSYIPYTAGTIAMRSVKQTTSKMTKQKQVPGIEPTSLPYTSGPHAGISM